MRLQQSREAFQQRRLAGTVWPKQSVNVPGRQVGRNAVQNLRFIIAKMEIFKMDRIVIGCHTDTCLFVLRR